VTGQTVDVTPTVRGEPSTTTYCSAIRSSYISNVIRAGADLKQAMTLARHSDAALTTKRYARTQLHGLNAVVDRIPEATGRSPEKSSQINDLKMTGTNPTSTPDVLRNVLTTRDGAVQDGTSCEIVGSNSRSERESSALKIAGIQGDSRPNETKRGKRQKSRLRDLNPGPPLYESYSGSPVVSNRIQKLSVSSVFRWFCFRSCPVASSP